MRLWSGPRLTGTGVKYSSDQNKLSLPKFLKIDLKSLPDNCIHGRIPVLREYFPETSEFHQASPSWYRSRCVFWWRKVPFWRLTPDIHIILKIYCKSNLRHFFSRLTINVEMKVIRGSEQQLQAVFQCTEWETLEAERVVVLTLENFLKSLSTSTHKKTPESQCPA